MAINFDNRYTDVSSDEMHLTDYLQAIVANWKSILLITLAITALGTAYAFLATPVYRADVLFHVVDKADNNKQDGLQPLTGMFDTKPSTAAEIELMKSRLVTEETVKALHLDIAARPHTLPFVGGLLAPLMNGKWGFRLPPSLQLPSYAWGNESIKVSRFDTAKDMYDKDFTLIAGQNGDFVLNSPDGVAILEGHVGENVVRETPVGPIALRVDALVGAPGTRYDMTRGSTLTTVERLQKSMEVAESTLQSGVIRASLEGSDPKLTADIMNNMAREFIRQDIESRSSEAEHMLAFLDQQLPQLRKELDAAEQRYNTFRNQHGTVDLSEESRLLLQQIVDNKTKLVDLQTQRAEMSQRFTANHPAVAALDAQIRSLQGNLATMGKSVQSLPDTEQTALRLLRDVHVDTELYTNLLNSAQQLRIAKAGQVGDVRIVDFAEAADDPVRPKRLIVILISFGAGLFIGIVFAFVRKTLYGGVERPDELEAALGVPVFAVVPRSEQQIRLQQDVMMRRRGLHVLAEQAPQDIAVEGVRNLRTSLQLTVEDSQSNVVMLTGSRPDAGKSFLSVNLSALVASVNKRTLVIDGDMRRGDVHSHFGLQHQPGLSDVLRGGDLQSSIQREVLPGLDVLTKGSLPSHPSELLMSKRFETMLEELKKQYDLIIIDTPPVLAVTDSTVIGKHVGTTLLVIRHGRHPVGELAETAKRLRNGGVNLQGVLLTDVPQAGAFIGSGYRGGYYGYESIAG
ncbi:polysaccharide biosynthesis tyrosine autokinase [Paraburkholderia diazotrophica]|uniref:Putative tyrosine-protein kinase EpsB n=1 Tax=Paraburkholderia diazotrophica TaxID=667676 RepID=A0A1H7DAK0_9BURK|nr:polysaccharide biosynthesis tyrosine autokinase [Paraburkholderia diazotrophica]SEJ96602.1 tyrosine-protein kinase Etk/Wzc [Paraburkholderia diazotrophica]